MAATTKNRVSGRNGDIVEHKGGVGVVTYAQPYAVDVEIKGTEAILFHRYDCESVRVKGDAKKGSVAKKTDDIDSYVYRDKNGELCMPGVNIKKSIIDSARYAQDPRSPRKSAKDLMRAAIKIPGDASFGVKTWAYIDKRPVQVQMNRITRARPALEPGWRLSFRIDVLLPEYIGEDFLHDLLERAGRTIGIGDFRPDFGSFAVVSFHRSGD